MRALDLVKKVEELRRISIVLTWKATSALTEAASSKAEVPATEMAFCAFMMLKVTYEQ
jgi:hypothetical protein